MQISLRENSRPNNSFSYFIRWTLNFRKSFFQPGIIFFCDLIIIAPVGKFYGVKSLSIFLFSHREIHTTAIIVMHTTTAQK